MKLTMLGILTVLLVAILAAPAAAAVPLTPGSYIADVINPGTKAICGRMVISSILPYSLVFSVDFQTGPCSTGIGTTVAVPARFDLCYVNENGDPYVSVGFIKTIEDTNANGKIDGLEGILKGLVGSGNVATTFMLEDSKDGSCSGTVLFRTGYKQP